MISTNETSFFLVETNESEEQYPLQRTYNGNGFARAYDSSAIYRFTDETKVKEACKVQNMMNSLFGSNKTVNYAKEDITRQFYNDTGNLIESETTSEGTSTTTDGTSTAP